MSDLESIVNNTKELITKRLFKRRIKENWNKTRRLYNGTFFIK